MLRHIIGVDDNGAAVVSMLEAIRQLREKSEVKRQNTMIFVSFDIEEEGKLLKRHPRYTILLMKLCQQ